MYVCIQRVVVTSVIFPWVPRDIKVDMGATMIADKYAATCKAAREKYGSSIYF